MHMFMVERDLAGFSMSEISDVKAAAVRQAVRMYDEGDRIRYIRSVYVPEDGRCLCLFEAKSAEIVRQLNQAARLPFNQVVVAMDLHH